jgi:hypothetical protein
MLFCWVFTPAGSKPINTIRQIAATPKANVTSTSEKPAVRRKGRFMRQPF